MELRVPPRLQFGDVSLALDQIVPADEGKGLVPFYRFHIVLPDGSIAGHLNFRVGDNEHIRFFAGNIGYTVQEGFRGHGYAYQACRAVEPFVRSIYESVIITCDPENSASRRTIEKLGCDFLEKILVPPHDPQYARGSSRKLRYRWTPAG